MSPPPVVPVLLAELARGELQWRHMPPAWFVVLVLLPLVAVASWWAYRRETEVPRAARLLLGTLRGIALAIFLLVLAGPFAETYDTRKVKSHLVVLVDASQSMATVDGYENEDARALAKAAGVDPGAVSSLPRIELVKRVLGNPSTDLVGKWTGDFRLHVFTFGSQAGAVVSTGENAAPQTAATAEETPEQLVRKRLAEIQATDPATRIGQAVASVVDTFRMRDEQVAGIVLLSDGQENGTAVTLAQAARKASTAHVPVWTVGVGDPRSPKNVHVSNLRAKEVVLARDDAVFEFSVRAKGFEGRRVKLELLALDSEGRGRPLTISPADAVLTGGDGEQTVRFKCRFDEAGVFSLKVGIPVQDEEKIKSDNHVLHTIRVIDRKIRVLIVDAQPRHEFYFLSQALVRDVDTMLAHTLLLDVDPDTPQRRSMVPNWPPLADTRSLPTREKLFDYDVVLLGDVNWTALAPDEEKARERLRDLRDFVDRGGGLVLIAGERHNPTRYKDTDLAALLPVVVERKAEQADPVIDRTTGFALRVTPEGRDSPMMNILGDAETSVRRWETDPDWRQFWSYPALRGKTLAKVLAVSSHPAHDDARYGPRPVIATMMYGRGRVLWVGVDDLWRMRKDVGDRYYYRFYGEAIRFLATYKLLSGNTRFKILTDRDQYSQDDRVRVTLDVLDRDFEPAKQPFQTITIDAPGAAPGTRETIEAQIPADPAEPGTYRKDIHPTRPGEYRLTAATDDPTQQPPVKIFRVVESTVEGRDLLLDAERLRRDLAEPTKGRYLDLAALPALEIPTQEREERGDKHEDELWDDERLLLLAVGVLAAEWLLRKRWNLV